MHAMSKLWKQALGTSLLLLFLCGVVYPLALTGVSKVIFPKQATGSIVEIDGQAVGSRLIGQDFTDARYFKGRVSAVSYNTYEPGGEGIQVSSGSFNYGATNPALKERVGESMEAFLAANPTVNKEDIPTELLTASGSGLDPHISPASARVQIAAIAEATGLTENELNEIIDQCTGKKALGLFGEETVNVLMANIEIAKRIGVIPS